MLKRLEVEFEMHSWCKVSTPLTWDDVLLQDNDMVVAVTADLLMVEAQSMEHLMLHYVMMDTARPLEGQGLLSSLAAHK
ncbi:hypothetical protein SRHO_G00169210 [Serrasalmus rhombeus]